MAIDYMKLTRRLYVLAGVITKHNTPTGWSVKLLSICTVAAVYLLNLHAFCNGCVIAGLSMECVSQTIVFLVVHVQTLIKFAMLVTRGECMKQILDFVDGYVFKNDSYSKHIYIGGFYVIALTILSFALFPFVFNKLPFFYESLLGSGSFLAFASSYCLLFSDMYLIQFVSTTNDFTFLLCADAICYRLHKVKLILESIEDEKDEEKLIEAIKEHQAILRTLQMLADMISPNFFMQVYASLAIVIFSAYSGVTSSGGIHHFSGCLSTLATLLTYCWLGQMVTNATEALHFASYNSKWYNCNKKMKMNLEIFSTFTREPFEIRGCSIIRMDLQTFKEVVTDSYSYLMILITMDETS